MNIKILLKSGVVAAAFMLLPMATMVGSEVESKNALTASFTRELFDNLDVIGHNFRVKYAPKEWKKILKGWDLEEQISLAKGKALAAEVLTLQDCRQILIDFFHSCSDYHVTAKFYSTAFSYLPFRLKSSQGRYFVTWVDKDLLWGRGVQLEVGDELLAFDGQPVADVVAALQEKHFNRSMPETDHALAELCLTLRLGSEGMQPMDGEVALVISRHGICSKSSLEWISSPEEIASPPAIFSKAKGKSAGEYSASLGSHPLFHRQLKNPLYDAFVDVHKKIQAIKLQGLSAYSLNCDYTQVVDDDFFAIGSIKGYVPILGKVIWRSPNYKSFPAYIYEHPIDRRRIGYIRIPHYDVKKGPSIKAFARVIKEFESLTDALVVDQVSNPGGELFYAYAIASLLSNTPLRVPTHRFTITQEDVQQAFSALELLKKIDSKESAKECFGNNMGGYRVDLDFARGVERHFQFVVDQWNAGNYITEPFPLYGIEDIKPDPTVNYTKPILMLVDHLDFSAADFLPAIMQDNGRATIFGSPTGGAGGFVGMQSHPNYFGLSYYSYTASFAERPGRIPLENLGVTPDILYVETPFDLQTGYLSYAAAVNKAVTAVGLLHVGTN